MTTQIEPMVFLNTGASIRLYRTALAYQKSLRQGYTREERIEFDIEEHLKKHAFYANLDVLQRFHGTASGKKSGGAKVTRASLERALYTAPHAGTDTHAHIIHKKRALI